MAYGHYRTITIDETKCGTADSTNFPLLIQSTVVELKTTANGGRVTDAQGDDIIFSSSTDPANILDFERVSYDATTGAVIFFVRIPTLSASANTVIYMLYGNADVTTYQGDNNGTWNANFSAVYHMGDATSSTVADSTTNGITATENGTTKPSEESSKVGLGQAFNGANSFIGSDNAALDMGTGEATFFAWGKNSGNRGIYKYHILGKLLNSGDYSGYSMGQDTNYKPFAQWRTGGTNYAATGSSNINDGNWHRWVFIRNSTGIKLYIDATDTASNTNANTQADIDNDQAFTIGAERSGNVGEAWGGSIDELYVMKGVAATVSWITSDYNNQNSPSTFYAVGAETEIGGSPPAAQVAKINGIALSAIAKYQGIAKASISKINGLTIQ